MPPTGGYQLDARRCLHILFVVVREKMYNMEILENELGSNMRHDMNRDDLVTQICIILQPFFPGSPDMLELRQPTSPILKLSEKMRKDIIIDMTDMYSEEEVATLGKDPNAVLKPKLCVACSKASPYCLMSGRCHNLTERFTGFAVPDSDSIGSIDQFSSFGRAHVAAPLKDLEACVPASQTSRIDFNESAQLVPTKTKSEIIRELTDTRRKIVDYVNELFTFQKALERIGMVLQLSSDKSTNDLQDSNDAKYWDVVLRNPSSMFEVTESVQKRFFAIVRRWGEGEVPQEALKADSIPKYIDIISKPMADYKEWRANIAMIKITRKTAIEVAISFLGEDFETHLERHYFMNVISFSEEAIVPNIYGQLKPVINALASLVKPMDPESRIASRMDAIKDIVYEGKSRCCVYFGETKRCPKDCPYAHADMELESPPGYKIYIDVPFSFSWNTQFPVSVDFGKGKEVFLATWRSMLPTKRTKVLVEDMNKRPMDKMKEKGTIFLEDPHQLATMKACKPFFLRQRCKDAENCRNIHIASSHYIQAGKMIRCTLTSCPDPRTCVFAHPEIEGCDYRPPPTWGVSKKENTIEVALNDKTVHIPYSNLYDTRGTAERTTIPKFCMDPDCVMWSRCPDVHVHPSLCYDRIMRKELRPVFDLMFTIKWFVTKCVERVTKSVIVLDLENLRNNASLDRYEGDVEMSCTVKDSKGEDRYIMQRINRQKPIHELKREVNTKYSKDSTVVCFQCSNSVLVEPCPRVYHQKVPEFCDSTREKLRTIVETTVDPNRGADVKLYTFKVSQYCMEVTHPDPILLGPVFSLFHNSTEKLCDEKDTDIRVTFQKAGEDWPTTFSKDKEFVERAMFSETGLALIADGYEDAFPETFWQTAAIVMDQRVVKKPKEALLYKLDCLQSARNIQQHFIDHKVPGVVFRIIEKEWYIKSPPKSWKRESDAQECFKGLLNRSTDVLSRCTFLKSRFIVEFKDVLDAVECALILESISPLPFKWEEKKKRILSKPKQEVDGL